MNKYNWSKQTINVNNENIYVPCRLYFEHIYKKSLNVKSKKKLISLLLKKANRKDFEKIFLLETEKGLYNYKKSKYYNFKKFILKILDFKIELKTNFKIHSLKYERMVMEVY